MAATILLRRLCQSTRQNSGVVSAGCRHLGSSEAASLSIAFSSNSTAMEVCITDRHISSPYSFSSSSPSLSPSPSPSPSTAMARQDGMDFYSLHHHGYHPSGTIFGTTARTMHVATTAAAAGILPRGDASKDGQVATDFLLSPRQQRQHQESIAVVDNTNRKETRRTVHKVNVPKNAAAQPLVDDDVNGYDSSHESAPRGAEEESQHDRSILSPFYGGVYPRALLVDAAGTLIIPTESMTKVYLEIGRKYGVTMPEADILHRYRWAYGQPWGQRSLRYEDDGRHFWRHVVGFSTGCYDPNYFEELYTYYATAEAWKLVDEESVRAFEAMKASGLKIGVVSNFDTRLRRILKELGCDHWFDTIAVSAEVRAEKPNPVLFLHACEQLGVEPHEAVHVGDDRRNDVWGARDAGCHAWLWGSDVFSFKEVAELIGVDIYRCEHERLVA